MSLNLVRNSKVFFTTNVNATTGVINLPATAAFSATNTFEIQVLDGFTFGQTTNSETVTVNEAGSTPVRGQRSFNTSLAPVDFSFSTYLRPSQNASAPNQIQCDESVLWNALFSDTAIASTINSVTATSITVTYAEATGTLTFTGSAALAFSGGAPVAGDVIQVGGLTVASPTAVIVKKLNGAARVSSITSTVLTVVLLDPLRTAATPTLVTANTFTVASSAWNESVRSTAATAFSSATTALSEKNQLQKFGMLFLVDNVLYAVDNCALNQVTIDFGLDQIATAQWTGQATAIRQLATGGTVKASGGTFTGGAAGDVGSGAYRAANNNANFITNKLSTASIAAVKAIGTNITAGESFTVPITGGSITINNNITYITPANLGVVNLPITYFTGTRAITGTLNAYLRALSTGTGGLFSDLVAEAGAASAGMIEPMFELGIQIGGTGATVRIDLDMPTVSLSVPSLNVEQIVSTTINFTAQGYAYNSTVANQNFDLTQANEFEVSYFA